RPGIRRRLRVPEPARTPQPANHSSWGVTVPSGIWYTVLYNPEPTDPFEKLPMTALPDFTNENVTTRLVKSGRAVMGSFSNGSVGSGLYNTVYQIPDGTVTPQLEWFAG